MAGDEHDGRMVLAIDPPLEFQPADIRKLNIENQASGTVRSFESAVAGHRIEGEDIDSSRSEQVTYGFANARIIIDDEYYARIRAHIGPSA
jgi:hypothetical protein